MGINTPLFSGYPLLPLPPLLTLLLFFYSRVKEYLAKMVFCCVHAESSSFIQILSWHPWFVWATTQLLFWIFYILSIRYGTYYSGHGQWCNYGHGKLAISRCGVESGSSILRILIKDGESIRQLRFYLCTIIRQPLPFSEGALNYPWPTALYTAKCNRRRPPLFTICTVSPLGGVSTHKSTAVGSFHA